MISDDSLLTIVSVFLSHKTGTVTRPEYSASAVGEVNVVEEMKKVDAIIGGEGNGGIIYPDLHFGRDALVGVALFLSHLSLWKDGNASISELRASYPSYFMSKNKIALSAAIDVQAILDQLSIEFADEDTSQVDGLKIDFEEEWVHLRKSNTEPIIRVYTESKSPERAEVLAMMIMDKIKAINP